MQYLLKITLLDGYTAYAEYGTLEEVQKRIDLAQNDNETDTIEIYQKYATDKCNLRESY